MRCQRGDCLSIIGHCLAKMTDMVDYVDIASSCRLGIRHLGLTLVHGMAYAYILCLADHCLEVFPAFSETMSGSRVWVCDSKRSTAGSLHEQCLTESQ